MDWFLYDNGLRLEMVKYISNPTSIFIKTQLLYLACVSDPSPYYDPQII